VVNLLQYPFYKKYKSGKNREVSKGCEMAKKEKNIKVASKTVKLDLETHKRLRIYAVEKDLWLGEAVTDLLDRIEKKKDSH